MTSILWRCGAAGVAAHDVRPGRLTQRVSSTCPDLDISPNETYLYTVHEPHANTDILVIDGFR